MIYTLYLKPSNMSRFQTIPGRHWPSRVRPSHWDDEPWMTWDPSGSRFA